MQEQPGPGVPPSTGGEIARRLVGDLPCVRCRYNLRGLSVRGRCPECGTAVRATILHAVDPFAAVLRPIGARRWVATGLMVWTVGALAAGGLTWLLRATDVAIEAGLNPGMERWLAQAAAACLALSGIGALALVRPHGGLSVAGIAGAALGVAAYGPLVWLYWTLHGRFDPVHVRPYQRLDVVLGDRAELRLAMAGVAAAVLVGLRPNVRMLVTRSLLLRKGRVDRQTMLAMLVALAVGALGDSIHLLADRPSWATVVGTFLIAVSSMFVTVGLAGAVADAWRIALAVLTPAPSLQQVMGPARDSPAGGGS